MSSEGGTEVVVLAAQLQVRIEYWAKQQRSESQLLKLAQEGKVSERALALYLSSLRHLFIQSQSNLLVAIDRCNCDGRAALARVFERKSEEEFGHERWAEADLATLSLKAAEWPAPSLCIQALVEHQRRLIKADPVAFLCYTLWAEYFTVLLGDEWVSAIELSGFNRSQMTAVTKHVEADREHAARSLREIDDFVHDSTDIALMLRAVDDSALIFESFCNEVCGVARGAA